MLLYLQYCFFIITLIILVIFLYVKIKYKFWSIQPVFHVYNLYYYIFPPGIIDHYLPEVNKYVNFKNVKTIYYNEFTELQKTLFVSFIKQNYLQNKDNCFIPEKNNIFPYFNSHNTISFISLYYENVAIQDIKNNKIIDDKKIAGVITTRRVHIRINYRESYRKNQVFDAYYVDYLCVDKEYRNKGIAPQLIQTHHYNQRYNNKNIVVSLFKREDELTGIVPLCVYKTYGFSVVNWVKPLELDNKYKIIEINKGNFNFFIDFLKANNKFDIFELMIMPDYSNIIELVTSGNIFINAILYDDNIICCYFFRKTCTFIDKDLEVLNCFASVNGMILNTNKTQNKHNNNIFIHGFKISFWNIANKNKFGFCAIENISHNNIIIDNIRLKTKPYIISPTAYFFYNFAHHTFNSNKVLIIN